MLIPLCMPLLKTHDTIMNISMLNKNTGCVLHNSGTFA